MSNAPVAPAPPSKAKIFARRLGSTLLLWAIVIGGLFCGNRLIADCVFIGLMTLLAIAGLIEFYDLARKRELACFKCWGITGGVLLMVGTFLHCIGKLGPVSLTSANDFQTALLILFVLGLCVRQFLSVSNPHGIVAIATTLFGLMYVPWLLSFITQINYFPTLKPGDGTFFVLYFILVTKFSDMGAYCVGSLIGKHKMIPRISPGKTWEGFGGAIVVSTIASVVFVHLAKNHMGGMNTTHAIILGVILSISAVVGDLIESLFKREAGLKDSGKLFPGIGGILDLLDSLLFNAPIMYLYLRYILTNA